MKSALITLLQSFNYPVYLQGSLNPDDNFPDSFFTFWNVETPETAFYDNNAGRAVWRFNVFFYSIDPMLVESVPESARQLLKNNGWIIDGKAHDVSSGVNTHTGAMLTIYKFENYESEE